MHQFYFRLGRHHPPLLHVTAWAQWVQRRRRPKGKEADGVPVEPNRPNTLSGGAAAPLEFDE